MPWKECSVMEERLRFVAQLLDGEAMSEVCRALDATHAAIVKPADRLRRRVRRAICGGSYHSRIALAEGAWKAS
jgi:hypothetical protein